MALDRELIDLGLSPKEAKVYLSLLELGRASAQAIADRAGLVRPTTYVILEALARKGLASKVSGPEAKKLMFAAEAPERLQHFLERQQFEIEQRRRSLEQLLPSLRSRQLAGEERPRVRMFEGKEGLKALQQEFVSISTEPMVGMLPVDELQKLFPLDSHEYERDIRSVRVKAGVWSRHLYTSARGPLYTAVEDAAALRESRYVPSEKLPIKSSFTVHGPLLSAVTFRNKIIGVLVEHRDITESFQAIFDRLWEYAAQFQTSRPPSSRTPS